MPALKNKWAFSLFWVNLAVGIVMLVLLAAGQISTLRDLLQTLAYALIYANVTGLLGVFIIDRILGKLAQRKLPVIPVVLISIVALTAVGSLLVQGLLMQLRLVVPVHFWPEYWHTLRVATPLGLVFALGAMAHGSLRNRMQVMEETLRDKELAEERLQKLAVEARLRSLEARIHPHFLFNTLNSISALIPLNPGRAEELLGRLAVLLRASLDSGHQPLIPLRQELAMVTSYIEIEKVRFGDKLATSIVTEPAAQEIKVPPMSVQSLVENAVKHSIAVQSGGTILIAAAVEHGRLRGEVHDTGPGFSLAAVPAGHGLDNLVQRLTALFGDSAGLRVFQCDHYSVVEMSLPAE
jgi:two-component system sensor histidine kinase AlgZ